MTTLEFLAKAWLAARHPNVTFVAANVRANTAIDIDWAESGVVFLGRSIPSGHNGTETIAISDLASISLDALIDAAKAVRS